MDFRDIATLFGGSIFPEEYRGDFEQFQKQIDSSEKASTNPQQQARWQLAQAVLAAESGNFSKAYARLASLDELDASLPPSWHRRCQLYKFWFLVMQTQPPVIRFRQETDSSSATIATLACNMIPAIESVERLPPFSNPIEDLEFKLLKGGRSFNDYLWTRYYLNPRHAQSQNLAMGRMLAAMTPVPFQSGDRDQAWSLGMPSIAGYLHRLQAEIQYGQGLPAAVQTLNQAREEYLRSKDAVGAGSCYLLAGDMIASPPFTNPLALNFIVEGRVTGSVNQDWDTSEDGFQQCDYAAIEREYEQARRYMSHGKSARGQGAVDLRLGCLYHMAGIRSRKNQDLAVAAENFSRAQKYLSRASDHFKGDEAHIHIVETHQILVAISTGVDEFEYPFCRHATMIGVWGRSSQSTSLTQFLGLLMMRYARYMNDHLFDTSTARKALICASLIFEKLGDPVFKLQSLLARACLSKSAGSLNAAQFELDETLKPLEEALDFLHKLGVSSPSAFGNITAIQTNVLSYFNQVAHNIYADDPTGGRLRRWKTKFDDYCHRINNRNRFGSNSNTVAEVGTTAVVSTRLSEPSVVDRAVLSTSTSTEAGGNLEPDIAALIEQMDQAISTASDFIHSRDVGFSFELSQTYQEQYSKAHAALEKGKVDEYKAHLESFLEIYRGNETSYSTNSQFTAGFKLTALTLLNDFDQAREVLSLVVPVWLGGKGTSSIEDQVASITVSGESLALPKDYRRQAAERAIAFCAQARDWPYGMQVMRAAQAKMPEFVSLQHKMPHAQSWQLVTEMGAIYEHNGHLKLAFECYLRARSDLETRRCRREEIEERLNNNLRFKVGELFSGLARVSLKFEEMTYAMPPRDYSVKERITGRTWCEQALLFVEEGRGRFLLDLLLARKDTSIDPAEYNDWAATAHRLRRLRDLRANRAETKRESGSEENKTEIENWNIEIEDWNAVLRRLEDKIQRAKDPVRSLLPTTLFRLDFQSLLKVIPPKTLAIETIASREGLVIFYITNAGIAGTHISNMSDFELMELVHGFFRVANTQQFAQSSKAILKDIGRRISDEIIKPIEHIARLQDHIIFSPTSVMASFPHAALILDDEYLGLNMAFSLTPSLAVLSRISQSPQPRTLRLSNYTALSPPEEVDGKNAIAMAYVESAVLGHGFGLDIVRSDDINVEGFTKRYQTADAISISSHGHASRFSPWESWIDVQIEDESPLRVADLAPLESKAALVIFSACQSGRGVVTAGSDVIGFSHIVLQSGAQSYMGGLWDVDALASALLSVLFHGILVTRSVPISLATCWQKTQRLFHSLDHERTREILQAMKEIWEQAGVENFPVVADFGLKQGRQTLDFYIRDLSQMDFSHPYFWSAFQLTGVGSQCVLAEGSKPTSPAIARILQFCSDKEPAVHVSQELARPLLPPRPSSNNSAQSATKGGRCVWQNDQLLLFPPPPGRYCQRSASSTPRPETAPPLPPRPLSAAEVRRNSHTLSTDSELQRPPLPPRRANGGRPVNDIRPYSPAQAGISNTLPSAPPLSGPCEYPYFAPPPYAEAVIGRYDKTSGLRKSWSGGIASPTRPQIPNTWSSVPTLPIQTQTLNQTHPQDQTQSSKSLCRRAWDNKLIRRTIKGVAIVSLAGLGAEMLGDVFSDGGGGGGGGGEAFIDNSTSGGVGESMLGGESIFEGGDGDGSNPSGGLLEQGNITDSGGGGGSSNMCHEDYMAAAGFSMPCPVVYP